MKLRLTCLLIAAAHLYAQDAASVLNRYVQVTGGAELYKRYNALHLFYTVTHADKTTENVDYFHTRDGKTFIESDSGSMLRDTGVTDGVVWSYSKPGGAQILSGKPAARFIAQYQGFDEDDWHIRFPAVTLLADQMINKSLCKHVQLTRSDGSTLERFYDIKSGLLIREISTEIDPAGIEQPVTTDFERYDTFFGIRRPTSIHIKEDAQTLDIEINTVTYSPNVEANTFQLPNDVANAMAAAKTKPGDAPHPANSPANPGGLPSPADLLQKYIEATGGDDAYNSIQTEFIRAEVSFTTDNIKFPVVTYASGDKQHSIWDIPSMGKFESGDNGQIAWDKSVVMGPSLRPHSAGVTLIGPEPGQILEWAGDAVNMQTVSKDQVNGKACYLVRMGAKDADAASACFDTQSGLLLKTLSPTPDGPTVQIYSDYRKINGVLICHRIDTKLSGHAASVQIKDITMNGPLPPGIFDLPADIQALAAKRAATQPKPDSDRPTLKRPQ